MLSMVGLFMLLLGFLAFTKGYGHLLMMLISLEFMVLVTFLLILTSVVELCYYVSIIMLVFSVCEGALGLTIMVAMVRGFGGDYLSSFYLSL